MEPVSTILIPGTVLLKYEQFLNVSTYVMPPMINIITSCGLKTKFITTKLCVKTESTKSTKEITTAFCSLYHSKKLNFPSFSLQRGSKISKLYFFQLSFSKTVENLLDYNLYFVDTPRIFIIIAKLSIGEPGSSLVLIIVPYIEISSWEVVTYGIYARVNLFSQNERASATSE